MHDLSSEKLMIFVNIIYFYLYSGFASLAIMKFFPEGLL